MKLWCTGNSSKANTKPPAPVLAAVAGDQSSSSVSLLSPSGRLWKVDRKPAKDLADHGSSDKDPSSLIPSSTQQSTTFRPCLQRPTPLLLSGDFPLAISIHQAVGIYGVLGGD